MDSLALQHNVMSHHDGSSLMPRICWRLPHLRAQMSAKQVATSSDEPPGAATASSLEKRSELVEQRHRLIQGDDSSLYSYGSSLGAVFHIQFLEYVADVKLDRDLSNAERSGDRLIAEALGHHS